MSLPQERTERMTDFMVVTDDLLELSHQIASRAGVARDVAAPIQVLAPDTGRGDSTQMGINAARALAGALGGTAGDLQSLCTEVVESAATYVAGDVSAAGAFSVAGALP